MLSNPQAQQATTTDAGPCACAHCGLPVPDGLIEQERTQQFCCRACETAYRVIHDCGLDGYYRLRSQAAAANQQALASDADRLDAFDSDKFHDLYVRPCAAGALSVDLLLEGVHCAACIWLIEKLPRVVPGVIEARLSLRQAMVRVVWDPGQVKLSEIARALSSLGYPPHPARGGAQREVHLAQQRGMLVRLGVAAAIAGNTMLLAFALYAGLFSGMEKQYADYFRLVSMGLGVLSLAWPGRVFFRGAWAAIRTRTPNLDVPIALALGVGGAAGVVNVVMGRGEIYFDSLTVLVFLLLVGRFIQYRQQRQADDAVGLLFSMTPTSCQRVISGGGDMLEQVPIEALQEGDLIEVRAGELIPADGVVQVGRASIIAALMTGESQPVPVEQGDTVCAGARLVGATLRIRVSAVGEQSRLGKLMQLVQEGMDQKPAIVALTDRIAGWFVLAVSAVALATFAVWSMLDFGQAVDHTVALLIIACPCALGLATPLAIAAAIGRAARRDILIKSGAALDSLSRPGILLLDKTGTLTRGAMRVEAWMGDAELQPLIAEVERQAVHPIARAIVEHYGDQELDAGHRAAIHAVRVDQAGVQAQTALGPLCVGSRSYVCGNGAQIDTTWDDRIDAYELRACTAVCVALCGEVVAVLAIGDALHSDAKQSLAKLRGMGWSIKMLTGDRRQVADQVAAAVGVRAEDVHASVTPEQKLDAAKRREADGPVVMVGDGVNDAAALAAADVGVAVSGGAEASMLAADVYLARPGLGGLVDLVETARRCRRSMKRTLLVSLAYNGGAVALAALGYISPLVAAVLMPASSALVLALAVHGQRVPQPADINEKQEPS